MMLIPQHRKMKTRINQIPSGPVFARCGRLLSCDRGVWGFFIFEKKGGIMERAEELVTFFGLVTANYVAEFKKRPSPDATG